VQAGKALDADEPRVLGSCEDYVGKACRHEQSDDASADLKEEGRRRRREAEEM